MNWIVPLADLDYGIEEDEAVLAVLHSRWLTMGEVTQQFEAEFRALTGAKHAFAVTNATVALHLACTALGLGPGDEAITPALTFVATSNAVLYTGATPRFADICGPHDLTLDPEDVEHRITPATKAIVVMHYGGYACDMDALLAVAARHNLSVIEDAAHAPGAYLNGRHLGTIGQVGCFSFFSNKNLSTGEGGMIVTDSDELAAKIRLQRSHGMTSLTYDRHQGHAYSYDVVDLGYNYRIDEIRSALGRVQLGKLSANNAARRSFTERYWENLKGSQLELPFYEASLAPVSQGEMGKVRGQPSEASRGIGYLSSHHLMPVLLPAGTDRKAVIDALREKGIQTSIHYPPAHRFTYYRQRFGETSLPRTEDAAARELTLPLYPTMGADKVDLVCTELLKAIR